MVQKKSIGGIAKAIMFLLTGAVVSKILGFAREVYFAYRFGAGEVSDAYMLTYSLPELLFGSFALAINTNFIPIYMKLHDGAERQHFVSNLISLCVLASCCGCLVLNLFPDKVVWLFAASLPERTASYAIVMVRIVSLSLLPVVLSYVLQAYSQANRYFVSTAVTGIIMNVVLLATFFVATENTFYVLSIGVVCANILVVLFLLYGVKSIGFRYSWTLDFKDSVIWEMILLTLPLIAANLSWNLSVLVDRNIAAYLGTGVITAMSYGRLLSDMASSMIVTAVVTAAFPTFSRFAAEGEREKFASSFRRCFRGLCYVLCPISLFMVLFADDVVSCVLAHGAMRASDAKLIWECTACYAIGIIPSGLQTLLVKAYLAFRNTKTPAYVNILFLLCNIGLSLWTARFFAHFGVTLSTSASYFVGVILLAYLFMRKYRFPIYRGLSADLLSAFVLVLLPAAGVYYFFRVAGIADSLYIRLTGEIAAFFSIYIALLLSTHRTMCWQIVSMVRGKVS